MAVTITGKTTGATTVELTHESGAVIKTTAPKDNGGDGSSFSPTDLCAASLGACASTIMTMFARDKGIALDRVEFKVVKEMTAAPRKIGKLTVAFTLFGGFSDVDYKKLLAAARTCPVGLTLADVVTIDETFARG